MAQCVRVGDERGCGGLTGGLSGEMSMRTMPIMATMFRTACSLHWAGVKDSKVRNGVMALMQLERTRGTRWAVRSGSLCASRCCVPGLPKVALIGDVVGHEVMHEAQAILHHNAAEGAALLW
jgi:hypothetical protein